MTLQFLFAFLALVAVAHPSPTLGWRHDVAILADTLEHAHPKLLKPEVREAFDRDAVTLENRIERLDRMHAVAAIARLVASLHDGHTQVGLAWDPAVGYRRLPVRLYLFDDGVYVRDAVPGMESLLGARVDAIGGVPIDSVIARLRPWVHGDNESSDRDIVASRLVLAELLAVAGVAASPESVSFRVRLRDGAMATRTLHALGVGTDPSWVSARDGSRALPLYRRSADRPYGYADIDSLKIFWIQFNAVRDADDESLSTFARRALDAADRSRATRLVIDIRNNNGGDNTLLRPLTTGIIRSRFNQRGHLFAVIGRLTFSAAVNFAADLERFTEVTFVGEPTAAPPNHFGETRRLILPKSGLTVLYSSLYWQGADPRDTRPWIAPSIPVRMEFADFRDGHDPALDAIERAR